MQRESSRVTATAAHLDEGQGRAVELHRGPVLARHDARVLTQLLVPHRVVGAGAVGVVDPSVVDTRPCLFSNTTSSTVLQSLSPVSLAGREEGEGGRLCSRGLEACERRVLAGGVGRVGGGAEDRGTATGVILWGEDEM